VPRLRRAAIPTRRFMPMRVLPPSVSLNLRNHRKLLLVDRRCAFTGGMNISARHLLEQESANVAADVHFHLRGPIVDRLVTIFREDWAAAGAVADCPLTAAAPQVSAPGPESAAVPPESCQCRLIADGPGDELDRLPLLISGVVSAARSRVWVMTPYFLPEARLVGALQSAALRGVDVRIVVPERSNWPPVDWAMGHGLWRLVNVGVQIVLQPPPFCHTKYLLIDDNYALVGSSNLDPRSLRLNFELNVEVFCPALNAELAAHFEAALASGAAIDQSRIRDRGVLIRLRDAFAALFTPYL
ncbi:MAG: phospholipase D-like domain-containing protein, partial [Pseudomonadota bacterium]